MIVYKDLFSGDEVISDSYKIQPVIDEGEEVRSFSTPPPQKNNKNKKMGVLSCIVGLLYKLVCSSIGSWALGLNENILMPKSLQVPGLFEVESTLVAVGGGDVDIGCGNAFGGAGEDEGVDDSVAKENSISGQSGFKYTVSARVVIERKWS